MADIGFGGDEGHRHAVAHLGTAQGGFQDEEEFIGRTEAGGPLRRADDDGAGVLDQFLEHLARLFGVVDVADGLGKAAMRAEAFDFIEGEFRPRRDDKVIVGNRLAIHQGDALFFGMQLFRGDGDEVDALLRHGRREVDGDLFAVAPADGDPGIGRHEVIGRILGHDGDLVFLAKLFLQFIGHDGPAQTSAQNYDMCHEIPSLGDSHAAVYIRNLEYYRLFWPCDDSHLQNGKRPAIAGL